MQNKKNSVEQTGYVLGYALAYLVFSCGFLLCMYITHKIKSLNTVNIITFSTITFSIAAIALCLKWYLKADR